MRPVRLELQGFSAFRELTIIDFADIELVAFVGPTGSGKSSIIDAMTFALYGSAARYDERAVAPVINQMSTEARVRLDFEVGGQSYSATRIVRRTRTGGATTREARLESGTEVLAGDPKALSDKVTALLGLDFERFNKTVVLPQGRFSEFLHDKPATRQQLLRELLGLGIYERVGRSARERAKNLQNEADVLEGTLGDVGDLSDERLIELQDRATRIATVRHEAGRAVGALATVESQLDSFDKALLASEEILDLLGSVRPPADLAALDLARSTAVDIRDRAATDRDQARTQLRSAVDVAASGPSIIDCRLLLTRYEQLHALVDRLAAAETSLAESRGNHELAETSARNSRDELVVLHDAYRTAHSTAERAEGTAQSGGDRAALNSLAASRERQMALAAELDVLRSALSDAEGLASGARANWEVAIEVVEALERSAPAVALASRLAIGAPCPVCLQTVHEAPVHRMVTKSQMTSAKAARSAAETELQGATAARSNAEAALNVAAKEDTELTRLLTRQPALDAIRSKITELDQLYALAQIARESAKSAEHAFRDREDASDIKAALATELETARHEAAAEARTDQLRDQLSSLHAALDGQPSFAEADKDLAQAEAFETARREAAAQLEVTDAALALAESELASIVDMETVARQDFGATRDLLAVLKPPTPTDSLANDWVVLVDWCSDHSESLSAERNQIMLAREAAVIERDDLVDSVKDLASSVVHDLPTSGGASALAEIRDSLASEEAQTRGDIAELERERARVAKTRGKITTLSSDAKVAGLLGHLLRADGFQRWLLEEALADLVARATVRMQILTSGQYSLAADDGAFKIIDHRNADEIRDARSLSGGETFLTSLALALALADSSMDVAAEGTARLDSIFLDEGFGTLDPDALDVVAGTIEELGATGRMVGIVTHIRELAERMPVRFEVTKGASSSSVERVET